MNILASAELLKQETIQHRRWLHQHAENSWKECQTTDYIEQELQKLGVEAHRFSCGTGCWALIEGTHPASTGKTILLRADIDAMPGTDVKDVPYKSIHEGAVHSCGHDGHTAMLMSAAKILMEHRDQLKGNVKLVFEPAEELAIGGKYCVSQGVLENVDAAFAIHMWDSVEEGKVNIAIGPCMAGFYGFKIAVNGKSNTCSPKDGSNAIQAMGKVIENIQMICTNFVDFFEEPTTITLGKVYGGSAWHTAADHAVLEGVIRTFYRGTQPELKAILDRIVQCSVQLNGCTATVELQDGLNPLIHDSDAMNDLTMAAAKKVFGEDALQEEGPNIGGDTFASYSAKVPGVYARMGTKKPGCTGEQIFLHDDRYDFDDHAVLHKGTAFFVQVVMDFFESNDF